MSAANQMVENANPAYLNTRHQQLIIEQDGGTAGTFPIADLHALILCHPQITVTQGVFQRCLGANVPVIICNEKHLPTGQLLAFNSHTLHGKIIRHQAQASQPLKKQAWKTVIVAKIKAQAWALEAGGIRATRLAKMATQVKSGDPDNFEAQASAWYWPRLMGPRFRRDPDQEGANALLNYGYAILRASTARAITGAGLSPALGIFHHNQYNPYSLADDLMEPARPLVDALVQQLAKDSVPPMNRETKAKLLALINREVEFDGQRYYLAHALQRSAKSLADAFQVGTAKPFKPVNSQS